MPDVILDGQWQTGIIEIGNATDVTLEGLIIRHGAKVGDGGNRNGNSSGSDAHGAGIYNQGNLTLRNTYVFRNVAAAGGAGGDGEVGAGGGGGFVGYIEGISNEENNPLGFAGGNGGGLIQDENWNLNKQLATGGTPLISSAIGAGLGGYGGLDNTENTAKNGGLNRGGGGGAQGNDTVLFDGIPYIRLYAGGGGGGGFRTAGYGGGGGIIRNSSTGTVAGGGQGGYAAQQHTMMLQTASGAQNFDDTGMVTSQGGNGADGMVSQNSSIGQDGGFNGGASGGYVSETDNKVSPALTWVAAGGGAAGAGTSSPTAKGGNASGGIYNASGATLTLSGINTKITENLAAGGGSNFAFDGNNITQVGHAVGGVWNEGTITQPAGLSGSISNNRAHYGGFASDTYTMISCDANSGNPTAFTSPDFDPSAYQCDQTIQVTTSNASITLTDNAGNMRHDINQNETVTATIQDNNTPFTNQRYQWFVVKDWGSTEEPIAGATSQSFAPEQAQVNHQIHVKVSYTDKNNDEVVVKSSNLFVQNVNDEATGQPSIVGVTKQNQTLTANTDGIADIDGLPDANEYSYQWNTLEDDGTTHIPITGQTGKTLALTQDWVNKRISVTVSFIDKLGGEESVTSEPTQAIENVNDEATGQPIITGTAVQGQTLTANTDDIVDIDGLPDASEYSYQWNTLEDNGTTQTPITGQTGKTLTLTQDWVNKKISVTVNFTDQLGGEERLTSNPTPAPVVDINDPHTGQVLIFGTAQTGQTLTANMNSIEDIDGLTQVEYRYQWQADGEAIRGATANALELTDAQEGKAITVTATFIDNGGFTEKSTSAPVVVGYHNHPGSVTISGEAKQNNRLTANITEPDGLPSQVDYLWKADGTIIQTGNSNQLTLTQAHVGKKIAVQAIYTDNKGFATNISFTMGQAVVNENDLPEGTVTLSGAATVGSQLSDLSVSNNLTDADGLGAITYHWFVGGVSRPASDILTQADLGKTIKVTAKYTDGHGTKESVDSQQTLTVIAVNHQPTGLPKIEGLAIQGQTLTANTDDISDKNGLTQVEYRYQWSLINTITQETTVINDSRAKDKTFVLTQEEVDKQLIVSVNFTDDAGNAEELNSQPSGQIVNINDPHTGQVLITGTAQTGQTLTANTDSIKDIDGLTQVEYHYQWQADGEAIPGATASTLELTDAQEGKAITVTVTFTDNGGFTENSTSAPVVVGSSNQEGRLTIEGNTLKGQTLTAVLQDADGVPQAVNYRWFADNQPISEATKNTYTLTTAEVGKTIHITAEYTDNNGTAESVSSMPTTPICLSKVANDDSGSCLGPVFMDSFESG